MADQNSAPDPRGRQSTDTNGQQMHGPKWKWEWSPNTLAIIAGFIGMAVAWGYSYAELQTGRTDAMRNIVEIRAEIKRIDESSRVLDRHETRITNLEVRVGEASTNMRTVEAAIGQLSSDMRLTREILERLERSMTAGSGR